jgi:hypothetical protein
MPALRPLVDSGVLQSRGRFAGRFLESQAFGEATLMAEEMTLNRKGQDAEGAVVELLGDSLKPAGSEHAFRTTAEDVRFGVCDPGVQFPEFEAIRLIGETFSAADR